MRLEYMQKTKNLSREKIEIIRFILRNPLRADFSLLGNSRHSHLSDLAKNLQHQCRFQLGLSLDAPQYKVKILDFRGETVSHKFSFLSFIKLKVDIKLQRQTFLEMIFEDLHHERISIKTASPEQIDELIALYLTTQILVFVECGAYLLNEKRGSIKLRKTDDYERALYSGWFCSTLNRFSKQSDLIQNLRIVEDASKHGLTVLEWCGQHPEIIDNLTVRQLDKALSLNVRFINKLPDNAQRAFHEVFERARIASIMQLLWVEEQHKNPIIQQLHNPIVKISPTLLRMLEIPAFVWSDMIKLSEGKPSHDKLFEVLSDEMYRIGGLSLEQIMVQYCGPALNAVQSYYGDWFEKKYLYAMLQAELPKSRYRVFEGGKAKQKMTKKYDVDLIIEDVEADRLLLCQVKYRHRSNLPFLRSEWDEFFNGDHFIKGIKQLKTFQSLFDDPKIIDLVRTRTGRKDINGDYLRHRTALVFIHNISAFDFNCYDGIQFYDWNTLRNLLRRQIGRVSHGGKEEQTHNYSERVPLEDVEKVIEYLRDQVLNIPGALNLQKEWHAFRHAKLIMNWKTSPMKQGNASSNQLVVPFD